MNGQTDSQLLCAYAEHHSEPAFAELVRRHVDFVYSAALRMVCDSHLAEDVTQCVFLALAKNAAQLTDRPVLSGWLHRAAQNIAAQTVRSDVRRRAREQEAAAMNELHEPDAVWEHIAPHLDNALGELSEADRDALLLRYFEGKSAREMAQTMGTSEDAAQKRVSRAVERLREFFAKRGVTVGVRGLVLVISANAVQAAPVGLGVTISAAAAIAGTTIATTATATTIKAIAMTTLQKALITATIAAAIGTPILLQHQSNKALREQNGNLLAQTAQLTELQAENERLSNLVAKAARDTRFDDQQRELLRLRGEVSRLRAEKSESERLQEENNRLRSAQSQRPVPPTETPAAADNFPRETWAFAGYANPESAIQSTAWAALGGDLEAFLNCMSPDQQSRQRQKWQSTGKSESQARDELMKEFGRTKGIRILNKETLSENEIVLSLLVEQEDGRNETPKMKVERIGNEWKMAGPYRPPAQSAP